MKDFIYYAPTEVVFGEDSEKQVASLVKKYGGKRVLVHYGGQSAKKSGLLDNIFGLLNEGGIEFFELGGVVPNPRLSKVREGIALCREQKIDFILAVGGGSVIDSAKAIAYGVPYNGDVWDFYLGKATAETCLPVATVLTIPAAGSEMSESSVITNEDGDVKLGYSNNISRPKFAIMNPVRTYTLPPYQTAAGVTDMIMHTMERYFTHDDDMTLTDSVAEALMRTLKDSVMEVLKNPTDYRHRAQIMWGGSIAHNGLTGCGLSDDWATHQLEHELSGMFDATHGAGLAAIWPSWARYVYKENVSRFVRFAVNVMGVENDFTNPEATALKGIEAMEEFYHAIGMPINIHELIGREVTDKEIREMVRKCSRNYTTTQGRFKVLQVEDMEAIYRMAK
ncbi:MAG: iron-containing alcohol dehydrogenase [Prevotella sp.]|nr:iron-containing alcohol dehydrogenase [Prevotella sp.]MBQ1702662.1 iron-containing alcohol dehydrogenase [Prevotella sp.]MBQ1759626.1 iron-containing alcohol dehydrogenase [Prevotella sp.]MBR6936080.1 iron-containing alcohol dehydrogenase [Prevotella sp.]